MVFGFDTYAGLEWDDKQNKYIGVNKTGSYIQTYDNKENKKGIAVPLM